MECFDIKMVTLESGTTSDVRSFWYLYYCVDGPYIYSESGPLYCVDPAVSFSFGHHVTSFFPCCFFFFFSFGCPGSDRHFCFEELLERVEAAAAATAAATAVERSYLL